MSAPDRVQILDKLNSAQHFVEATLMALADIDDQRQRSALDTVLYAGLRDLAAGIAIIDAVFDPTKAGEARPSKPFRSTEGRSAA